MFGNTDVITMATIKSFTSLEQSKILAKILPLESADMYYISGDECDICFGSGVYEEIADWLSNGIPRPADIPCWSLAALLELTPNDVSLLHLEDVYQAVYDVKPYHITNRFDNPLDATFEMICWLKENNKL